MNDEQRWREKLRRSLREETRKALVGERKAMSVYPISSKTVSLDHKGGTKSYHLHLIQNADGKCVVINRWGKTGAVGEMKFETFDNVVKAQAAFDRKEREKTRNGYRQVSGAREMKADNKDELIKAVGVLYFNKMGANHVKHLDPAFDTTGMRVADDPQWDEDGNRLDSSRKYQLAAEEMAEAQRQEEERKRLAAEKVQQAYAENDLYGRF